MKKLVTSLCLLGIFFLGQAQTTLNEIYTDPGAGRSEFFELFNSSSSSSSQNVDNYTVLTYRNNGGVEGWYIIDLPNLSVDPKKFFVGAPVSPFNVQQLSNVTANFSWNDLTFRSGATGGSIKFAQLNAGRTAFTTAEAPNPVTDVLAGGNGKDYYVFVFVNGVYSNGFIGGTNASSYPTSITTMPSLAITCNWGSFTINFASANTPGGSLRAFEHVVSAAGSDNGYARTSDGNCGAWVKTSNSPAHTPGVSNGATNSTNGGLTTSEAPRCGFPSLGQYTITYDITAISNTMSEALDFPVTIDFYEDKGTVLQLDGADIYLGSGTINLIADAPQNFTLNRAPNMIVVYKTQRGCYDVIKTVASGCATLPVGLFNFNASRNNGAIILSWKTAYEQNNSGFDIERNVNGSWEKIGFVSSLGMNGNSSSDLSYAFIDRNNTNKGISQYRLRQVDMDTKATYSDVRAVRGDGQIGKITIYPNPTADGKVNILFDDANVVRTVVISDMSGRIVKQINAITTNNTTIMNLQPGMYTVKIAVPATGEQAVQKIVVNKR